MRDNKTCHGCIHLDSEWSGDGTTTYLCDLVPGLVKGTVSAFEDDEPQRCERYERERTVTP